MKRFIPPAVVVAWVLADQCTVDPAKRLDCIFGNQGQCTAAGCCWSPVQNGVPWCFYKSGPSPSCNTTLPCSGHGKCSDGVSCTCDSGYASCIGQPDTSDCDIYIAKDVNNCGSCGNVCAQGEGVKTSTCQDGSCSVTCDESFTLCYGECVHTTACTKPPLPGKFTTFS